MLVSTNWGLDEKTWIHGCPRTATSLTWGCLPFFFTRTTTILNTDDELKLTPKLGSCGSVNTCEISLTTSSCDLLTSTMACVELSCMSGRHGITELASWRHRGHSYSPFFTFRCGDWNSFLCIVINERKCFDKFIIIVAIEVFETITQHCSK